jgi:hypothetical protein
MEKTSPETDAYTWSSSVSSTLAAAIATPGASLRASVGGADGTEILGMITAGGVFALESGEPG